MENTEELENKEIIFSYIVATMKYNITLYEKKILYKVIENYQYILEGQKLDKDFYVEKDLWGDLKISFPILSILNEGDRNYEYAREALRKLSDRYVEYEDDNYWTRIRFIESPELENKSKIIFRMNSRITQILFNFSKGFRKIELKIAMELKSVYSLRFYELMANQRSPLTLSIDYLKSMFGIEDKYAQTGHFISRVVDPAQKELNETCPWTFTYKKLKSGRKITALKLFPVYQPQFEDSELKERELRKKLSNRWYIPKNVLDSLKNKYEFTDEEIRRNDNILIPASNDGTIDLMGLLSDRYRDAQDARNPKGWIIGAIKKEYAKGKAKIKI